MEIAEGEVSLGRSQSANISVKDASVSRNHARLQAREGRLTIQDLNSSNGTFLNGMRIFAEAELHDGDRLTLGESESKVRILAPESVAATMRIDPRGWLAGEELKLQAQEEAQAALAAQSSLPAMSAAPDEDDLSLFEVTLKPIASSHLPVPAAVSPAPAMPEPVPEAAPMAAVIPEPAPAALPMPPPAPPPIAEAPRPPEALGDLLGALPPLPPLDPPAFAPVAESPRADEFGLPEVDLPPLPPVDTTPRPASAVRSTGPRSSVASPAAAPRQFDPAGFWIRLVAALLDSLWVAVVCGLVWFATGNVLDDEQRGTLVGLLGSVLWLGSAVVGWSLWGATPGKLALGLRVFPAGSNSPGIGFAKGLLRAVGYMLSGIIAGVGFIMVAFTKGKRGLHDMIAGTLVGRLKKPV